MELTLASPTLKFQEILESVRKDHPYTEEIAWMNMDTEVREFLHQLDTVSESDLAAFAHILRNSQLDLIFHALLQDITDGQKEKLLAVLAIRLKRRLFYYNWIMLQEHYTNSNLIESFCILTDFMRDKYPYDFNRSLAGKIPYIKGDWISQALSVLESEGCTLDEFMSKYGILKNSRLAVNLQNEFFLHCSIDGFKRSEKAFIEWIKVSDQKLYPQINHYLDVMDAVNYSENINNYLIENYGYPGQDSFWDNIEVIFRSKFLEWCKLKDLGNYLGIDSEKYRFWKNYYHHISKVECYPDLGILFMYLPGHVVVDLRKETDKSYLYKKAAFQITCKSFEAGGGFKGLCEWPLDTDMIIPVKSVILENYHSEIYELDYERLGKLYIRDYLEMIL